MIDGRQPLHMRQVHTQLARFSQLIPDGGRVLVVGGGVADHGSLVIVDDPRLDVVSFDVYPSSLTQFIADAHSIPLIDGCCDAVLIQAVLEHVLDPAIVVSEIHRVLKAEGVVYAETPFMQQVHEGAWDFSRFTESGHRWLFRWFEVIDAGPIGGPGLCLVWGIDHLARGLTQSKRFAALVRRSVAWISMLDRWVPRSYASDAASAVYLLGKRSEVQTMHPRDMVSYYPGVRAGTPADTDVR